MPPENVFAYTAPGNDFPGFVSVNKTAAGGLDIIVRSPKENGGATAQMALTREQAAALAKAMVEATPLGDLLS